MEILSGNVLTTSPVANLGSVMVTVQAKRGKLGNRLVSKSHNQCANAVYNAEGSMCVIVRMRYHTALWRWNASHVIQ